MPDEMPDEKTLGLTWNPNSDELCFDVKINNQSLTKRGILSTIFSIYDPLFIVSPALVKAKTIFQKTCSLSLGWDDLLPKDLELSWKIWLEDIVNLKNCKIPRCYFNSQYDNLELHLFCDGSETAYGSVAYLRSVSPNNVQCSITLAKLRLVPLKRGSLKTIPRIELNSAKLALILYLQLVKELDLDFSNVYFWTDSTIVLSYIRSKDRKFQRFVSNRIAFIHSHTSESMWKFVPGELNPADILSRGTKSVAKFVENDVWFKGPSFLYKPEFCWPKFPLNLTVNNDSELVQSVHATSDSKVNPTEQLLSSSSNWYNLKCKVASYIRLKDYLKTKQMCENVFSIKELNYAETCIWKFLQQKYFKV